MNGLRHDAVEKLREISNNLESDPLCDIKKILFPGWDEEYDGQRGKLVREAAKAILAKDISRDNGTEVSQKALSALIHYIADMME